MARPPAVIAVVGKGSAGSSAGILVLFLAVVGLVAFFTGNLERWIDEVAGPAGAKHAGTVPKEIVYVDLPDTGVAPVPGPTPPQRVPGGAQVPV